MGYYIDPPNCTKEEWLHNHAIRLPEVPSHFKTESADGKELLAVCLVDNGPFTAAGVMFSQDELEAFTSPHDHRPKKWWLADRQSLEEVVGRRIPVMGSTA